MLAGQVSIATLIIAPFLPFPFSSFVGKNSEPDTHRTSISCCRGWRGMTRDSADHHLGHVLEVLEWGGGRVEESV